MSVVDSIYNYKWRNMHIIEYYIYEHTFDLQETHKKKIGNLYKMLIFSAMIR